MKICSLDGCTDKFYGRGFCLKHYARWRRHGDPHYVKPRSEYPQHASSPIGYRTVTPGNYVRMRISTGWELEHRVVMEQLLDRPLIPGEEVHHKNGTRTDNRPENLELWVCSQPAGQRVEDLVAWAKEILILYG